MIYPEFYRYWGKTASSTDPTAGDPYHLLIYHCLDVAACGTYMVRHNLFNIRTFLAECGLGGKDAENWIAWLFAGHDIGKFARGFQKFAHFPDSPLVPPLNGVAAIERHDTLGFYLWTQIAQEWGNNSNALFPDISPEARFRMESALAVWWRLSTGHHGIPPDDMTNNCSLAFTPGDISAATAWLEETSTLFPFSLPSTWATKKEKKQLKKMSWHFAGLITLADWTGSDQSYFPLVSTPMPLNDYWLQACAKAEQAFERLPANSAPSQYHTHKTLFPFINQLTPLQQTVNNIDVAASGPQLTILEDITGAGKTEAALILAHRMLSAGKGAGLYVGLPTMATANAMYTRLACAYRALFSEGSQPSLVLAHGGRHMSGAFRQSLWQPAGSYQQDYSRDDKNASGQCHIWFADSRKKALLADVGVGTLDQALMAVMPFRHQSLRLLGISNKILILDEVHAYDGYMVKLLEGLLNFHAAQGGSAIILSATLPAGLREKLLTAFNSGANFPPLNIAPSPGYPWLSDLSVKGLSEQQIAPRQEVARRVGISWLESPSTAIEIIYRAVARGQCICWIRNTVDDARLIYQQLLNEGRIPPEDLLLFHSRYAFTDRLDIEDKTLCWFGKQAQPALRKGKVLIATQVVEQSLDVDFDHMISDLAPIDLLIQRAGRLQRHTRDATGQCKPTLPDERPAPELHILAPAWQPDAQPGWLGQSLRATGFVYQDHAVLWRTQAILRRYGEIRMPEYARVLIEGVYDEIYSTPEGLLNIADRVMGAIFSQRSVAGQNLLQRNQGYCLNASDYLWSDSRELSTRLGEETVDIYLASLQEKGPPCPLSAHPEFGWEMSRLSVRLSWWKQHNNKFRQPDEVTLLAFREQQHRPLAQLVLVNADGEAPYYTRKTGLMAPEDL